MELISYNNIRLKQNSKDKITNIREFLTDLQNKGDILTEKFVDDLLDKGWVIDPVSDPWGYYNGK